MGHGDAILSSPGDKPAREDTAPARGLSFGERLRELRIRRQLTQEALADLTGVSVRTLRYLESGRIRQPRPGTMRRLAESLELTPAERRQFQEALTGGREVRPEMPSYPTWLPPGAPFFVGREVPLRELDRLIFAAYSPPEAPTTAVVSGAAGIGKTALAGIWAHRNRDAFPGGQLYIDLRGFDPSGPPVPPADGIRAFLGALAVPPQRIPSGLTEQIGLFRTLTTGKRILVVIDNARDADQVRPLLPGAGARAVITSRNPMVGLVATEAALPIMLDILSHQEAHELLLRRLGHDRVEGQGEAVNDIISRCTRLPLALALVAARAASYPRYTLGDLADELRRTADALSVIASDEPASDLRTIFSWSYRSLTEDAARTFRLLGLHPGPHISLDAAASLLRLAEDAARPLLAQLARAGLVAEPVPGRFLMHDLLRSYAGDLSALESPMERRSATNRMLDHYLALAFRRDAELTGASNVKGAPELGR